MSAHSLARRKSQRDSYFDICIGNSQFKLILKRFLIKEIFTITVLPSALFHKERKTISILIKFSDTNFGIDDKKCILNCQF